VMIPPEQEQSGAVQPFAYDRPPSHGFRKVPGADSPSPLQQARCPGPPHGAAKDAIGTPRATAKRNAADNIGLRPLLGARAAKVPVAAAGSRNSRRFAGILVAAGRVAFRDLLFSIDFSSHCENRVSCLILEDWTGEVRTATLQAEIVSAERNRRAGEAQEQEANSNSCPHQNTFYLVKRRGAAPGITEDKHKCSAAVLFLAATCLAECAGLKRKTATESIRKTQFFSVILSG
jgi:hypothetical protein